MLIRIMFSQPIESVKTMIWVLIRISLIYEKLYLIIINTVCAFTINRHNYIVIAFVYDVYNIIYYSTFRLSNFHYLKIIPRLSQISLNFNYGEISIFYPVFIMPSSARVLFIDFISPSNHRHKLHGVVNLFSISLSYF